MVYDEHRIAEHVFLRIKTRALKMNNKLLAAALLITPLAVVVFSTLSFNLGFSPQNTKNNGILFKESFDVTSLNLFSNETGKLTFDDGKWIFGTYASDSADVQQAMYLMRQLNVALNRDINKLKRVLFSPPNFLTDKILTEYPRTEVILDTKQDLYRQLKNMGGANFFDEQQMFIIDPYGRAVIFFPLSLNPKLILKDLKVLI
jgi:hypothetical protein